MTECEALSLQERLQNAVELKTDQRTMENLCAEALTAIKAAENDAILGRIKSRLDLRLNDYLCEMREGYDDSIVGFNEAWDIMRAIFAEEMQRAGEA